MEIKGLGSLIKNRIDELKITQELFGRKIGVSGSAVKKLINDNNVVKIDVLLSLEREFGSKFRDLLKNSPNGQKIDDLIFGQLELDNSSNSNKENSFDKLLTELEKQTKLLEKLSER